MQYADPDRNWVQWLASNGDLDEATKLAALREYIFEAAEDGVNNGDFTAEWADKKLAKLGITQRLGRFNTYEIEATVVADIRLPVAATDRAQALSLFRGYVADRLNPVIAPTIQDITFVSGPEDADLDTIDPDAPTTVDDTLTTLRGLVLLAVISGPKICVTGANDVLEEFGLPPVPERSDYVITRTATATLRTRVNAFDEASATTVAGWRWDNERTGWTIADAIAQDDDLDVNPA